MLICGVQINFSLVLCDLCFLTFFYFDEVLMSLLVSFFFNKIMNFHFDIFFFQFVSRIFSLNVSVLFIFYCLGCYRLLYAKW